METGINDYIKLFEQRGKKYDSAMKKYPAARDEEFLQAIKKVDITGGMCIADIPAGGEYLKHLLPYNILYFPYEPCESFYDTDTNLLVSNELLPLPFDDNSMDIVFSIAGIHHLKDKTELFKEVNRILKPNGYFVLSDVKEDSEVAQFLDGFVGDNNSTGHKGIFLNQETPKILESNRFEIISLSDEKFYWKFDSLQDMAIFCNTLFDMCHSDREKTIEAIKKTLGTEALSENKIGMNWELMSIVAKKIE